MAVTVETILGRIEAAVKAITPTKRPATKYRLLSDDDADLVDQAATSGMERAFEIQILDGEHAALTGRGYHHPSEYLAIQSFAVLVKYPLERDFRAQQIQMASDRHDIKVALDDHGGDDVPLQLVRRWTRPERRDADGCWILGLVVECQFLESAS